MATIIIEPEELWGYFEENEDRFDREKHEIASAYEYGVKVFVTKEYGLGVVSVNIDDEEYYSESFVDMKSCTDVCKRVYLNYLTQCIMDEFIDSDSDDSIYDDDIEWEIQIREEELDTAVIDFIDNVLDCSSNNSSRNAGIDNVICDLKNHFLEYMHRKWGFDFYRPMKLVDGNGEEFFEEYPYNYIDFDDEDNPIYKK